MNRKQKRLSIIAAGAVFLAGAAALVTSALREQIVFFNSPTDVLAQPLAPGTRVRLGGLVEEGTVQRGENSAVTFQVTDTNASVKVRYALTHAYVVSDFLGPERGGELALAQADALQDHRRLGQSRRLDAAVGAHPGDFRRRWRFSAAICRHASRPMCWRFKPGSPSPFLLFILLTSNPFNRLDPAPLEGNDLNPILQDIGIGDPSAAALSRLCRPLDFLFLCHRRADRRQASMRPGHAGCVRGRWRPGCSSPPASRWAAYWAYYELGWGGWWFWDPVENASFMPWLVAPALLHSAIVMEKREALKVWTVLLAILPSRCRCSAPSWCAPAC
jgi:hypothetical protein